MFPGLELFRGVLGGEGGRGGVGAVGGAGGTKVRVGAVLAVLVWGGGGTAAGTARIHDTITSSP